MKNNRYKLWFWVSGILLVGGCIHLYMDWLQYDSMLNSAPFSLWVAVNAIVFGIPALICLIVGLAVRHCKNRKDDGI